MRSQCNQRITGYGVGLAFVESKEMYYDKHPGNVRMPNDPKTAADHAALCGPVTTYFLNSTQKEQIKYGNR
ncbi:hypothetical protein [Paenibacillus agricola]|uniref:Uncharacterized protein n=1 Tax=Paenibacillus agricola TaxID=2716264 RepID=A0ABX0JE35_9BACL|nr:hypothetical protein [Paenibacillus agricola]NHN33511.1 hypothetical protein [Paenibacillus agricola]